MRACVGTLQVCSAFCAGGFAFGRASCVADTQFPEPVPGLSGFVGDRNLRRVSIIDLVKIPDGIEPGRYLLGWRWDCEQSSQVCIVCYLCCPSPKAWFSHLCSGDQPGAALQT